MSSDGFPGMVYIHAVLGRAQTRATTQVAQTILAWWRAGGVLVQDGVFAMTLAALAFAPGLVDNGVNLAELPHRPMDVVGIVLGLGQCLPLVLRRKASLVCLTLVVAVFAADQLLAYPSSFGSVGLLGALYAAGAYLNRRLLPAALGAAVVGYLGLCLGLHALGSPELPVQYLTFFLVLAGCWAAGQWMRAWRAGAETRRTQSAQLAVAEERARIARELHDVVTHHVTAMVVQSDAAQFLLTSAPDRAADGLTAISDTGRRAIAELRTLLDVLDGARPSTVPLAADAIDDLVARVRSAGQPVRFVQSGTRQRDTPDGVTLAVYRVVQEALTNAVKHAPGQHTVVQVDYAENDITVQVANERRPDRPTQAAGQGASTVSLGSRTADPGSRIADLASRAASLAGGRGIAGLRARVDAVGGELSAAPDAGGFVVRACLPLRATP